MSILVIGSLNMDMVINTNRMPILGETISGENFFTSCGGKGANQAVAMGKLTDNVAMCGCVGNDSFGDLLINSLKTNGIDASHIKRVNTSTGTAVIVVVNGDNFIVLSDGANKEITSVDIEQLEHVIKNAKLLVLQLEIPIDTVKKSIEIAKKHGVKVMLNPAPVIDLEPYILENTDYLILNELEAKMLTQIDVNTKENITLAINCLLDKGAKNVIITLGGNGVSFNIEKNIIHKNSIKVNVVDTTSAGDSFIGAFAYKINIGETIENAVDFAIYASALTVTKNGAQISLPNLAEVNDFIKSF